jgi:aryl-alcohol dehydrogenase-like predicted oxidoreductase
VTLQPQYSLLSREIEWEVIPAALHNGIGLLPWSPLAGGFLTGKYQRGGTAAADTRAGSEKPIYQSISEEYAVSDRNWDTIETVVSIAKKIGATAAQVALSWIGDRPSVIAPIVGARTVEHLRGNLAAADLHWTLTLQPNLRKSVRRSLAAIRTGPLDNGSAPAGCTIRREPPMHPF